jgi:hypothetical protein
MDQAGPWIRTDTDFVPAAGSRIFDQVRSGNSDHLPVALPVRRLSEIQPRARERMIDMLKRHEIQVLRRRARRQIDCPSKAEAYRQVIVEALSDDSALRSVELLHPARLAGYTGGNSALHALAQTLRTRVVTPLVRFEGLPGEFSQHDFSEALVQLSGRDRRYSASVRDQADPCLSPTGFSRVSSV